MDLCQADKREVAMNRFSWPATSGTLLILGAGVTVLSGCQNTTVDASRGALGVENSTEAVVADTDSPKSPAPAAMPIQPVAVVASQPLPPAAPVQASTSSQVPVSSRAAPARSSSVTIPARTVLPVELDKTLSSHTSQIGENFRAFLIQEVAVDGQTALPRHSVVIGRVTEAKPAKKVGGRARLSLEFYSVHLPDGQRVPLEVVFAEAGKSQTTKDAAIIGGSTLGGAVVGHAVDKGEGTAIGAIVGGLAGAAVANETRAKPVVVNSGTVLTLETTRPITVDSAR